jgi:hypothetical protein
MFLGKIRDVVDAIGGYAIRHQLWEKKMRKERLHTPLEIMVVSLVFCTVIALPAFLLGSYTALLFL